MVSEGKEVMKEVLVFKSGERGRESCKVADCLKEVGEVEGDFEALSGEGAQFGCEVNYRFSESKLSVVFGYGLNDFLPVL